MTRAIVIFAALIIFFAANPKSFVSLSKNKGGGRHWFLAVNFIGVLMLFVPIVTYILFPDGGWENRYTTPWLFGSIFAAIGVIFWYASPRHWLAWLQLENFAPLIVVAVAFFIPDLAFLGQELWGIEDLSKFTFRSVYWTLFSFGGSPFSEPETYKIGLNDFSVMIASGCSGIEGFVLLTVFICLYGFMFREDLRFPHYWIMIPIGIAVSWIFNVLRISLLVWIGANISPELAIEGFHSYAGWIAFTMLSLAVLWTSNSVSWFKKVEKESNIGHLTPLKQDWSAARLLPFVAFMLSGVIVSAFFTIPAVGYPLKALTMFLALAFFWRVYLEKIEWSLRWIPVGAGIFVGIIWLLLLPTGSSESSELNHALEDLGTLVFFAWVFFRIAGTVLLVPMVEELVFRGYILSELDRGSSNNRIISITISTALFAILHGKWLAAILAGLVFALIFLHRGKLADAIIAHMVANFVVASWAVFHQDWGAI